MSTSVTRISSESRSTVAALSVTASGLLLKTSSVEATAAVTPISISNIPLTVAIPAHPQVIVALGDSESMDGDMDTSLPGGGGAIMTGSGALTVSGASLSEHLEFAGQLYGPVELHAAGQSGHGWAWRPTRSPPVGWSTTIRRAGSMSPRPASPRSSTTSWSTPTSRWSTTRPPTIIAAVPIRIRPGSIT